MYLFKRHGLAVRVTLVWSREKHTEQRSRPFPSVLLPPVRTISPRVRVVSSLAAVLIAVTTIAKII